MATVPPPTGQVTVMRTPRPMHSDGVAMKRRDTPGYSCGWPGSATSAKEVAAPWRMVSTGGAAKYDPTYPPGAPQAHEYVAPSTGALTAATANDTACGGTSVGLKLSDPL